MLPNKKSLIVYAMRLFFYNVCLILVGCISKALCKYFISFFDRHIFITVFYFSVNFDFVTNFIGRPLGKTAEIYTRYNKRCFRSITKVAPPSKSSEFNFTFWLFNVSSFTFQGMLPLLVLVAITSTSK